jgi:hypothetical protein
VVTAGPARSTAALLLLAAGVLLAVALAADPAGSLLAGPAAVLLGGLALRDLLLRPVLRAGPEGLEVVTGLRRRRLPWSAVEGLRVVTDRRTALLELDLGSSLVVLPRARLGRAPQQVLDELSAVRPAT